MNRRLTLGLATLSAVLVAVLLPALSRATPTSSCPPRAQCIYLTITTTGAGSGTVDLARDWEFPPPNCQGSSCTYTMGKGQTAVTLTATADLDSTFTGWSGDAHCPPETGTCKVMMSSSSRDVSATFALGHVCVVPNLKGKTLKTAKRTLRTHYCSIGTVQHAFSSKVKTGRVIEQKPKPGAQLPHGAKVNLVISKGRG